MEPQTANPVKKLDLKRIFGTFDRTKPEDMIKLTTLIQEKAAVNKEYANYAVWNIDDDYAWIAPSDYSLEDTDGGTLTGIDVSQGLEHGAQSRTVKNFENEHRGMFVTEFVRNPSQPAKVYVRMEPLDEKTLFARQQFAAALNVDPWMIRVMKTTEGGWKIKLDRSIPYRESKYGKALQEAVETVGKEGWFFRADAASGVIMVYPGNPPTFAKEIPMPKKLWETPDLKRSYFGMKLPDRGRSTGDALSNEWKNSAFMLVCGESNGGKSVVIDSLIYGRIIAGAELYIGDEKGKSTDYAWCRPYVADFGWGCDGLESTAAMLLQVLRKVDERAEVWKENNWINWWDIPDEAKKKYPPILLVMDEISQLAVPSRIPAGLDKDNPDVIRKKYENAVKFSIQESMLIITQKARYVGVTGIYAAQSATQEAGIPPIMRTNLPGKIIVGEKVPDATRQSVLKDPKHAPVVPQNVIKDGVGKGTGVAELVGQEACVYKGYFEMDAKNGKDWADLLGERAMSVRPVPRDMSAGQLTWSQILDLFPSAAGKPDDGTMDSGMADDDSFPTDGFGVDGRDVADADAPLKGAAAAAHASKLTALEQARAIARQSAEKGM